jgi:hypothetical protein
MKEVSTGVTPYRVARAAFVDIVEERVTSLTRAQSHARAMPPHLELLRNDHEWRVAPAEWPALAMVTRRAEASQLVRRSEGKKRTVLATLGGERRRCR